MIKSKYYCWHNANLILELYIQTRASKNTIVGSYGNRLKITITAPPVSDNANKQLIKFLSKHFAVPQKQVQIITGMHNHHKSVLIIEPKQNVYDYPM